MTIREKLELMEQSERKNTANSHRYTQERKGAEADE